MSSLERLNMLVTKVLNDEQVSEEEYAEVIAACREDRKASAGTGKTKVSNLPDDPMDLFKM